MEENFERVSYFYDRTIAHIKCVILIQEYMNSAFNNGFCVNYWHDHTKFFEECHRGYYLMTFKYLGEKLTKDEEDECAEAWFRHYVNESHHPEFIEFSHHISDMVENDVFEMVCDWLAMSYEFKEGDWMDFWRTKMSDKFEWTNEQRMLIEELLSYAQERRNEIIALLDERVSFPKWKYRKR